MKGCSYNPKSERVLFVPKEEELPEMEIKNAQIRFPSSDPFEKFSTISITPKKPFRLGSYIKR